MTATEDPFRSRFMGMLIRWLGAFAKRRAACDLSTLRAIFAIIDRGGRVGVVAEGVRTWDGSRQRLLTGIAKLIRKLKVPVYVCRMEGAYLVYPRWARHLPLRGEFFQLFTPDAIPKSDDAILSKIAAAVSTHDFDSSPAPAATGTSAAWTSPPFAARCSCAWSRVK